MLWKTSVTWNSITNAACALLGLYHLSFVRGKRTVVPTPKNHRRCLWRTAGIICREPLFLLPWRGGHVTPALYGARGLASPPQQLLQKSRDSNQDRHHDGLEVEGFHIGTHIRECPFCG